VGFFVPREREGDGVGSFCFLLLDFLLEAFSCFLGTSRWILG